MIIKEISSKKFDDFSSNHLLFNHLQTSNYAILMKNFKYEIMYVGAFNNNELVAASLILYKTIAPTIKYGYAPRGFVIDYFNTELLKEFTIKLKTFFLLKNFAFIKINPEIIYSKIDVKNHKKQVSEKNKNLNILLKKIGYEKLKNNLYFESMLPKYNAIISLKKFDKTSVNEKCYKKTHSIINTSLSLKKGNANNLELFYNFVKDKSNKTLFYYKDLYSLYKKDKMIDLLLVELDYYKLLNSYNTKYENMIVENEKINDEFTNNPYDTNLYNIKIDSDNKLNELKHYIDLINRNLKEGNTKEIIGGALLITQNNRVNLIISGFNEEFSKLNYKYFLYYKFMEYYKKLNYSFLDLNGISGNFTEKNPYKGLNDFKLSFNPDVYEYIGEYDLVINNTYYNILWNSGKLRKEFDN